MQGGEDSSDDWADTADILHEVLGLPSDQDDSKDWDERMRELGVIEVRLRKAEAVEAVEGIRRSAKRMGASSTDREKNVRGYDANTRAKTQGEELQRKHDLHITHYDSARTSLLHLRRLLDDLSVPELPVITNDDTRRKPPEWRRQIGDSRQQDGRIWGGGVCQSDAIPYVGRGNPETLTNPAVTSNVRRQTGPSCYTLSM